MNWFELTKDQVKEIIKAAQKKNPVASLEEFSAELEKDGVLMLCESHERVRALTHLDVNAPAIDQAAEIVATVAARLQSQS